MIHLLTAIIISTGLHGAHVRADYDGEIHLAYQAGQQVYYARGPDWSPVALGAADWRFGPAISADPLIVAWTEPGAGAIMVWDGQQTRRIHGSTDGTSNRPDVCSGSVVSQQGFSLAMDEVPLYRHTPDEPQWPACDSGMVAFSTYKGCGASGGIGLLTPGSDPTCPLGWSGFTAGLDLAWPHLVWLEWYEVGEYRRVGYANLATNVQRDLWTQQVWADEWPPVPQIAKHGDQWMACWHDQHGITRCTQSGHGRTQIEFAGVDPSPVWAGQWVVAYSRGGEILLWSERPLDEATPTPVPTATPRPSPTPVIEPTPTPAVGECPEPQDLWTAILWILCVLFGGE